MEKVAKILAPTDLSEPSKAGVELALKIGQSLGAEVVVYNVVTYEETSIPVELARWASRQKDIPRLRGVVQERQRVLRDFLKENFAELMSRAHSRVTVDVGVASERIVEKAAALGADLIVISTHGRGGLSRLLMGSVTERVVRHARCPVLSVHVPKPAAEKATKTASKATSPHLLRARPHA